MFLHSNDLDLVASFGGGYIIRTYGSNSNNINNENNNNNSVSVPKTQLSGMFRGGPACDC